MVVPEHARVEEMLTKWARSVRRRSGFARKVLRHYCHISTLHGVRNVADEDNKWIESGFWLCVCGACSFMTLFMVASVWQRFQQTPTMTTVESHFHPVRSIPFPAVTICNTNKILNTSARVMAKKFVDHGMEEADVIAFLNDLPQVYTTRLGVFPHQEEATRIMKKLGYTLETFLFEMAQPCSRLLVRCMWLGIEYNCSSMFVNLKTPEGFCCSFNWQGAKFKGYKNLELRRNFKEELSVERLDMFNQMLYISEASTPSAGLTVVIDSELDNYFSSVDSYFGSVILLHQPDQYPDAFVPRAYVQPRFEVMFRVSGSVIESSENVRGLKISQRQCYFTDEVYVGEQYTYNYDQCLLQCKLAKYQHICGCIPFYYPQINNTRPCRLFDAQCIRDNRGILTSEQSSFNMSVTSSECRCLPQCSNYDYNWISFGNKIYTEQYASPLFLNDLSQKSMFSVFFTDNTCIKYRRESLMTWDGLLAAFGGIFGLCLGGSIVSLIELFYYFVYVVGIKALFRLHKKRTKVLGRKCVSDHKGPVSSQPYQTGGLKIFHIGKLYQPERI